MNTPQAVDLVHAADQKAIYMLAYGSQSTSKTILKGDSNTKHKTNSYVLAYGSQHKSGGMMQRKAFYALCYGASIRTAVKASGLSIRRVKVIAKQLPRGEL